MNQPSVGQQVQAQAMANGLAGERGFKEIRIPVTGDFETELIGAVMAACEATPTSHPSYSYERIAQVLEYLMNRFRSWALNAKVNEERQIQAIDKPGRIGLEELGKQMREMRAQQDYFEKKTASLAKTTPPKNTAPEGGCEHSLYKLMHGL